MKETESERGGEYLAANEKERGDGVFRFEEVDVFEIAENAAALIGREQMLITAMAGGRINTMTASWGAFGFMWGVPVFICAVRPSRYTFSLIEQGDAVSFSFLGEGRRRELSFCGSISGHGRDKIKEAGFTPTFFDVRGAGGREVRAAAIGEARLVMVCEKMYFHDVGKDGFLSEYAKTILPQSYSDGDFHRLFITRVLGVYARKEKN